MPWQSQGGGGGGPWGGGGGQGPWGGNKGGGGGGGSGSPPPDIEEMLRRSQDKVKRFLPSGGSGKGIALIALVVVVGWLLTGFYRVDAGQQGVALIFGKLWDRTSPGLHYNIPSPIGEVLTPKVTRVNRVEVGFRSAPSRGAARNVIRESLMLTGDENIIDTQFVVFWQIKDAFKFLFNVRNPEATVKAAAESAMREVIGKSEFEFVRTTGRGKVTAETQELIQSILDEFGAGILVRQVEIQGIEPPAAVIDAFKDVAAAKQDAERAENEATAYRNEITQRALGEAAQIVAASEAYKAEEVAKASGETQRFLSVFKEYEQDKVVTRRRLYLQTMEEVLQPMEKILIEDSKGGSGVLPYLPLDQLRKGSKPSSTETTGDQR